MRRFLYVVAAVGLCLPAARATAVYGFETASGASDGDGSLSGTVIFTVSGTNLYISVINNEANPTADGQLISDLTFDLTNGVTELTAGTLSSGISSSVGTSTGVTVLDSNFKATTTTTTPSTWQLSSSSSGYFLNDLTGAQPENLIIGPGPYTNFNPSITNHAPSLGGTVVFEVTGVTGLTDTTTVSNVVLSFGTTAGVDADLSVCTTQATCGGNVLSTPEPASIALTGAGLIALGMLRRKFWFGRR